MDGEEKRYIGDIPENGETKIADGLVCIYEKETKVRREPGTKEIAFDFRFRL